MNTGLGFTYHDDITVVIVLGGQSDVRCGIWWHIELDVGQLGRLADGPVKERKSRARVNASRVKHNVLDANIKVDGPAIVGVLRVYHMVTGEPRCCFQHRGVCWVSHQDRSDVQLERVL